MRVTLDQDQWEPVAEATLGEVFAEVSDRAYAQSRIVTAMRLDQQAITDRDLDAGFLAEPAARYGSLTAVSQSMQDMEHDAWIVARRYAKLLHAEGAAFVGLWRAGRTQGRDMDLWLGKLADYLEFTEGKCPTPLSGNAAAPLSSWVQEFLSARESRDEVLMADLLEYEILPRLEG